MVRGTYIAGTGMLVQRRNMEVVTNNIVNSETTAYKKDTLIMRSFDDVMIIRADDMGVGRSKPIGSLNFGAQVDEKHTDFSPGSFEETGRSTDIGLVGDVFFVFATPAGERYGRAGAFYVDSTGYLTDGDGNYPLGNNGPIYVGSEDFKIAENGAITVADRQTDTLRLASFDDNRSLRKQGDNLYFSADAPIAPRPYAVKQGFVEMANLDIGREMVEMLALYRSYETNQRMLTMTDEITGKAVNEIGRVR